MQRDMQKNDPSTPNINVIPKNFFQFNLCQRSETKHGGCISVQKRPCVLCKVSSQQARISNHCHLTHFGRPRISEWFRTFLLQSATAILKRLLRYGRLHFSKSDLTKKPIFWTIRFLSAVFFWSQVGILLKILVEQRMKKISRHLQSNWNLRTSRERSE